MLLPHTLINGVKMGKAAFTGRVKGLSMSDPDILNHMGVASEGQELPAGLSVKMQHLRNGDH